jgi:hypothetical protein
MVISNATKQVDLELVLDEVIRTGVPAEVERGGQRLQIIPIGPTSKLSRLLPHPNAVVGDPEDLVHLDWSSVVNVDLP